MQTMVLHDRIPYMGSGVHCCCCFSLVLQYFQTAEDLGLFGRDPTLTASKAAYVATGKAVQQ